MRPPCNISSGASAAAGLTFIWGVLKLKGDPVETTSVGDGLHLFLDFVSQHPNSVMIGHNIQSFDIPILINQLSKHNMMKKFQSSVCGFIDTLKSRRVYPKAEMGNYRQENLLKNYWGKHIMHTMHWPMLKSYKNCSVINLKVIVNLMMWLHWVITLVDLHWILLCS